MSSIVKHGTTTGYNSHKRLKETPCDPCKAARSEATRKYRARPEVARDHRARSGARTKALGRLAAVYPDIFQVLYREELAKMEASK